jgi:hypothetical protein
MRSEHHGVICKEFHERRARTDLQAGAGERFFCFYEGRESAVVALGLTEAQCYFKDNTENKNSWSHGFSFSVIPLENNKALEYSRGPVVQLLAYTRGSAD